ncbi:MULTISPECIES: heme oxygenase (biliverdin-producing) [Micromonospora]|uniref:Heme oxygenase n=2 Tax=Micromonospora TaxID=1873 RepID=A0A9X0I092_9ACTN|nr:MULTISPECIES: biliverdin-producing heme oxygenase [Micromonospora]AEB44944.1 heme oxygenase [Micromonospora maris AB-18-032]KUJ44398.1 heme oxygenase [Micromonospora maris]RUL92247.1 biliverdin-producing heme oxygenase [Verrucosispora sp. FIM060022]GIJ18910.1 biliverdin-producing heme oxygenase [Micromonospora gifhornensis]
MGFAAEVRELTRADHRAAQSVTYFDALLSGHLDRAGYAALLEQLHVVYQTLEEAADTMRDDPVAGPFVVDELRRLPRIVDDLSFLHGPDWTGPIVPSAATDEYRARLREVAFSWPAGFVAHHYTRYLGDLSGGQVMARALHRTFGFDTDGVQFFLFPGLDARAFKQQYRELLDAAPWDAVERQRFLDEVSYAYRLNTAMLDDLGRAVTQESAA